MRHDPSLGDAASLETPIQTAGGTVETRRRGVAKASTLRKMRLAGLGIVLALPGLSNSGCAPGYKVGSSGRSANVM